MEALDFNILRLEQPGPPGLSLPARDELLLAKLVTALVVGDLSIAEHAALELRRLSGARVGCKVHTPFGGASFFPLQAVVCAPLDAAAALRITLCLLDLGASPNICWVDAGGSHTPLSKALTLRNMPLAELLVQRGADCTAALLHTVLLERSRFDPALVTWLLDRGADVAPPLQRSASSASMPPVGLLACQDTNRGGRGSGSGGGRGDSGSTQGARGACTASQCRCPPVPAVGVLLSKLRLELIVHRQLTKLHAMVGSGQHAWLLRRTADCLQRVLAAGAEPVGAPDPSGQVAVAVAGLQPADWAAIRQYATQPPSWSPQSNWLFPRPFREAVRQVLLVAHRGFSLSPSPSPSPSFSLSAGTAGNIASCSRDGSAGGSDSSDGGDLSPRARQQRAADTWWLDGGIVLCIIKHLAPCSQL